MYFFHASGECSNVECVRFVAIIALSILVAIVYGILHDQITARICVEYFTVGHPPVFHTQSPTLLGLGWGIIATWWVGLLLGIPLALAARVGSRPKRSVQSLLRPIVLLLVIMGICALCSGVVGWILARSGVMMLVGELRSRLPHEKHAAFLADAWAHSASYLVGFLGGLLVVVAVWRSRSGKSSEQQT
jgi:hypothetical protein